MIHPLCPVRMFAKWIAAGRGNKTDDARVFTSGLRTRAIVLFRMAGTACGLDASRLGTHSMRSGGASAMFAAGYEVEVIKRRGRWLSSTFQQYLWRDQLIMSTIGRGMVPTTAARPVLSRNNGRAGGKVKHGEKRPPGRLSVISHELVKLLRHKHMREKQRGGFVPVDVVLRSDELSQLYTNIRDLEQIVNGAGGNWENDTNLDS